MTAKLSRQFYERFGDELTNELVNWMNMVDAPYRSDFRELFEVHFGRFDAKLEQRVAELEARMDDDYAGDGRCTPEAVATAAVPSAGLSSAAFVS